MIEATARANLEPEFETVLRKIQANGFSSWHSLGLKNARAAILWMAGALRGELEPVPTIVPLRINRSDGTDLPALLYRTADPLPVPVLVYMHGGGWALGDNMAVDAVVRRLAIRSGCAILSVDYRLASEHKFPAALDDVITALEWVRTQGAAWNLDPARLAVGGDSSGANLAAAATLKCRETGIPLAFQMLVYPALDHDYTRNSYEENSSGYNSALSRDDVIWFHSLYVNHPGELDNPLVSPLRAKSLEGLPRTLLISAEFDPLLDENLLYTERLREAEVDVGLHLVQGVFHGFWRMPGVLARARECIDYAACQLRNALNGATHLS